MNYDNSSEGIKCHSDILWNFTSIAPYKMYGKFKIIEIINFLVLNDVEKRKTVQFG